jgi:hypothetical protein
MNKIKIKKKNSKDTPKRFSSYRVPLVEVRRYVICDMRYGEEICVAVSIKKITSDTTSFIHVFKTF